MGCLAWTAGGVALVAVVLAVATQYLSTDSDTRHRLFAGICNHMNNKSTPEMTAVRCELLNSERVRGSVLEIGPGPGPNFVCFENNTGITKWVGAEPNTFFDDYIRPKMAAAHFETELLPAFAENLEGVPDASVDTVVSTHVLCSVNDTTVVLKEILRVLKPGGRFVFMEHVSADSESWLHTVQQTLQPVWRVFGDGCEFRDIEKLVRQEATSASSEVSVRQFDAPIPLFLVKPHVTGWAIKK